MAFPQGPTPLNNMINNVTRIAATAAIILGGADSLPRVCEEKLEGVKTTEATIAVRRVGSPNPVAFLKATEDSLVLLRAQDGAQKTIKARAALLGKPNARERILQIIEDQIQKWV